MQVQIFSNFKGKFYLKGWIWASKVFYKIENWELYMQKSFFTIFWRFFLLEKSILFMFLQLFVAETFQFEYFFQITATV